MYVRPKKHLGQHFLRNPEISQRIADSVPDIAGSVVLEIGPGTGALTEFLIRRFGDRLWVAETDPESVEYLRRRYPELSGRILEGDILNVKLADRFSGPVVVAGNFPYNISSQILFWMLDQMEQVPALCGMFQKEVALRIAGGPGNKDYGILSVLVQAWYDATYLFSVDEHEFHPPPKVKSGVIRLEARTERTLGCDESGFRKVVKAAFNQRRKTLRNSLRALASDPGQLSAPIFDRRPEQLSVGDFEALTRLLGKG